MSINRHNHSYSESSFKTPLSNESLKTKKNPPPVPPKTYIPKKPPVPTCPPPPISKELLDANKSKKNPPPVPPKTYIPEKPPVPTCPPPPIPKELLDANKSKEFTQSIHTDYISQQKTADKMLNSVYNDDNLIMDEEDIIEDFRIVKRDTPIFPEVRMINLDHSTEIPKKPNLQNLNINPLPTIPIQVGNLPIINIPGLNIPRMNIPGMNILRANNNSLMNLQQLTKDIQDTHNRLMSMIEDPEVPEEKKDLCKELFQKYKLTLETTNIPANLPGYQYDNLRNDKDYVDLSLNLFDSINAKIQNLTQRKANLTQLNDELKGNYQLGQFDVSSIDREIETLTSMKKNIIDNHNKVIIESAKIPANSPIENRSELLSIKTNNFQMIDSLTKTPGFTKIFSLYNKIESLKSELQNIMQNNTNTDKKYIQNLEQEISLSQKQLNKLASKKCTVSAKKYLKNNAKSRPYQNDQVEYRTYQDILNNITVLKAQNTKVDQIISKENDELVSKINLKQATLQNANTKEEKIKIDKEIKSMKEFFNALKYIQLYKEDYEPAILELSQAPSDLTKDEIKDKFLKIFDKFSDKISKFEPDYYGIFSRMKRYEDFPRESFDWLRGVIASISEYESCNREFNEYKIDQSTITNPNAKAKISFPFEDEPTELNISNKTLGLLFNQNDDGTLDLSFKQGIIGDCYLLTSLDIIFSNQDFMKEFLQSLKEESYTDESGNEQKKLVITFNKGFDNEYQVKFNIKDQEIEQKGLFADEKAKTKSPIINIFEEAYSLKMILGQLKNKNYDQLSDEQKVVYDKAIAWINGEDISETEEFDNNTTILQPPQPPIPPEPSNILQPPQPPIPPEPSNILQPPQPPIPSEPSNILQPPQPPIPSEPSILSDDNTIATFLPFINNPNAIIDALIKSHLFQRGNFGQGQNKFASIMSGGVMSDSLTEILSRPFGINGEEVLIPKYTLGFGFNNKTKSPLPKDVQSLLDSIKTKSKNFENPYPDIIFSHAYGTIGNIDNSSIDDNQPWNFARNINPHNNRIVHYNKQEYLDVLHALRFTTIATR